MHASARSRVALAFVLLYVLWGSTYLAIRIAVEHFPPFLLSGGRYVIAGLLPLIFLLLRGTPWPTTAHWRSAWIAGSLLALGGNGLVTFAERDLASSVTALIAATTPLFFVLIEAAQLRRTPRARTWLGVALGIAGVAVLVSPHAAFGPQPTAAVLALLAGNALWAFGSLIGKRLPQPSSIWLWSAMQLLCGGLALCALAAVSGEASQLGAPALDARSLLAVAYLIVFSSWLGFGAYVWLLARVPAAQLSSYAFVNPLVAVLLGHLVLAEPLTLALGQAAVAIVAGVMLLHGDVTRR